MTHPPANPFATRLAIRWQEAAWPVAVMLAPVARARSTCRSARYSGIRTPARNPYSKRFNP